MREDDVTPGVVGAGKKRLLSEDEEEAEESPSGAGYVEETREM